MKLMGIDIGTTTISMILMDEESKEITAYETVSHDSFLAGELPEEKIQDPERIWKITKEKMDSMIHACGKPDGIGLTGQMHGMLYVDGRGNAVSPLYTWQDGSGNRPLKEGKAVRTSCPERREIRRPDMDLRRTTVFS